MGAWGYHFDECDGALDFLGKVDRERDWTVVRKGLQSFFDEGGYDCADEAIAAIELVAAALGHPSPRLQPELAAWAAGHDDAAVADLPLALRALDQTENGSELNDLWAETENHADWRATLADLRMRLRP